MLIHFVILVVAFALMPIIPGVRLGGLGSAVIAAIVFVLVNFFLGWIIRPLLVIGTLGLAFLALNFLTNMVMLWVTDKLMKRFEIRGFLALVLASVLLTFANAVSNHLTAAGHWTHATQYGF